MSEYHLFWHGVFSQWFSSEFSYEGIEFSSAEQFMMYHKARFFGDHEIAGQILKETRPGVQKGLGRQVKNFDVDKWSLVAREIVYKGSECKFTQDKGLCKELISTYPKILVEASPYDKIWGIGLGEDNPLALNEETWEGKNWLGEVLTNLRNNIMIGNSHWSLSDAVMHTITSLK